MTVKNIAPAKERNEKPQSSAYARLCPKEVPLAPFVLHENKAERQQHS